ncbi:THO complex subunit 5 B [Trichonephila clavipes]|nr:THO complex subunit 5 B [Trichonephila clavipes]
MLYGLHQSGRAWYFELNNVLKEIGLQKLNWSNCTYFYGNSIVLLVYVDDIVIFGQKERDIEDVLTKLKGKFNLKIMRKTKRLLEVEFEKKDDCILIYLIPYIDEIYKKYEHLNIPISSLPIGKGTQYSKRQCPQSSDEKIEMKELEEEINVNLMETLSPEFKGNLLLCQLYHLAVCFDVFLETEYSGDSFEGPHEFMREKVVVRYARGSSRSRPYKCVSNQGIFTYR